MADKPVRVYRALFPFGGLGAGALGFCRARIDLLGTEHRFECIGGIDCDQLACQDFEYLTGAPSLHAHIGPPPCDKHGCPCGGKARMLTPALLRAFAGEEAPDIIFMSPPCKGASALLSNRRSRSERYDRMNRLALGWLEIMLTTWAKPPRLILLENVPRLPSRAPAMLADCKRLLTQAGYRIDDAHHECGELGGLAQIRRRYLLVARHEKRVPALLYQPPKRRVRGCGEVLAELPMPNDEAAGGRLHRMPRMTWRNWIRLAIIPAGGDYRDIPGVLGLEQPRREKFRRYRIERWTEPSCTVAASHGPNGAYGVGDVRVETAYDHGYRVLVWDEPSFTVHGKQHPGTGAYSVADPRIARGIALPESENRHWNKYRVTPWASPAGTVTGTDGRVGSGAPCVSDPRIADGIVCNRAPFKGAYGVLDWGGTSGAVTAESTAPNGRFSVADPRIAEGIAFDKTLFPASAYGVLDWGEPCRTVTGEARPSAGRFSAADVRVNCAPRAGTYGVLRWRAPSKTVTAAANVDNGTWAVADPRLPDAPPVPIGDLNEKPFPPPVIVSADGTWHRPFTTLECAVLQSLPWIVRGEPLKLAGSVTSARGRIGNAVPPLAAEAIAGQVLCTFAYADAGKFALGSTPVWVEPDSDWARWDGGHA